VIAPLAFGFLTVAVLAIASSVASRRRRRITDRGFVLDGKTVARCRKGHLFTTYWSSAQSWEAEEGPFLNHLITSLSRYQRCPIGNHRSLVRPVQSQDLTPEERAAAASCHDHSTPRWQAPPT